MGHWAISVVIDGNGYFYYNVYYLCKHEIIKKRGIIDMTLTVNKRIITGLCVLSLMAPVSCFAAEAPAAATDAAVEQPVLDGSATTEIVGSDGTMAISETPAETVVETNSVVGTLNSAGNFDINGEEYVVSERYSAEQVPAGFSDYTVSIGTHTYNEQKSGDMVIVYLKPANNTEGKGVFYLFDEAAGTVSTFRMITFAGGYCLLSTPPNGPELGMEEVPAYADFGEYLAYYIGDQEIIYIYGTDNTGYTGWFAYEYKNNRAIKQDMNVLKIVSDSCVPDPIDVDSVYDPSQGLTSKLTKYRVVISILVLLLVVAIFVILRFLVFKEEDDDMVFSSNTKGVSRRERNVIKEEKSGKGKSFLANLLEEDEDSEDSEDEEDEVVVTPGRAVRSRTSSADARAKETPKPVAQKTDSEHLMKPSEIAAAQEERDRLATQREQLAEALRTGKTSTITLDSSAVKPQKSAVSKTVAKDVKAANESATATARRAAFDKMSKLSVDGPTDAEVDSSLEKIDITSFMGNKGTNAGSAPAARPAATPKPAPAPAANSTADDDDIDLPLIDISDFK